MNKFLRLFFIPFLFFNHAKAQQWTWVNGNSYANAPAVFGTKGVAAAANVPAARTKSVSWTDGDGNFWLMGGSTSAGLTNDLWKFNPITKQWTWMSGSTLVNQPAVHGVLGVAVASNVPGAREGAISWADNSGNLWLMGGGSSSAAGSDYQADFWKYNIASGLWTWMGGSDTPVTRGATTAIYGTKGVPSSTNYPGSRYNSISWTDNAGNLWLMGGPGASADTGLNDLWKYNTTTNQWVWMSGGNTGIQYTVFGTEGVAAPTNIPGWRSMPFTWTDDNNNLWLMGGYGAVNSGALGGALNDLWKYDISTGNWTWMGGSNLPDQAGSYGTIGVESSTNIPGARSAGISWNDKHGNLWLMGGADDLPRQKVRNDLWRYNIASGNWTWMSGSNVIDQTGVYGTKGVASVNNVPGARSNMISWVDNTGALYLMGGSVYVSNSTYTLWYQDLWSYKPAQVPVISPAISFSKYNLVYYIGQPIPATNAVNTGGPVPANVYLAATTFAGGSTQANTDGTGTAAGFNFPAGLVTYGSDLFVADAANNAIRKISSKGVVSTLAGSNNIGYINSTGRSASFSYPTGITIDRAGNLYVADQNNQVIRKVTQDGVVTTFAGTHYEGHTDGAASIAAFSYPTALVADAQDNIFVTEEGSSEVRKITPAGQVSTFAGNGVKALINGTGSNASFFKPQGIAIDASGNLYVADWGNYAIRKITPAGVVTTLAGSGISGTADGAGASASFTGPTNIIADQSGNLYVTDQSSQGSRIRMITPAGVVTTIAGNNALTSTDGIGTSASFYYPWGITIDNTGNLYISDRSSNKIRKLSVTGYSVTPALPNGLSMSTSGSISGTPSQLSPATDYTISAHNAGGSSSAKVNITVNKITPKLTVTVPNATYGDADIMPLYVSNSTAAVTFTSGNPNVATIVNGKIHTVSVGWATIVASQAGNDTYSPVATTFIVNIKPQTLTVTANDATWNYGRVTDLPVTYSGFVNGDDASKLNTQPTVVTRANPTAPVPGIYDLIPTGAVSPNYTFIYINGKLTVTLPANNLKISSTSVTCKGSNNGSITLDPTAAVFYTAAITGTNYNKSYRFNTKFVIDSLAPNTYHICVSIDNLPGDQQCSDLVITEPKDLAVYATVNKTVNTVSLSLAGGENYTVKLNGTEYQTSSSSITLPLSRGSNKFSVTTDKLCQGSVEQIIDLSGITAPYPNPFQDALYVNLGESISNLAIINIFNVTSGRIVLSQKFNNQSGVVRLDTSSLQSGVYTLNLSLDNKLSTFKIIKK
jgi:hypothetical protein